MHFKTISFWTTYRNEILIACSVVLIQGIVIALLLIERRQRRLAEHALHQQRLELSHVSRLAVAGELTASIAHEINQPLGAILSNTEAAELILASGQDRQQELKNILADIRRDDLRANEIIRRLKAFLTDKRMERQEIELNQIAGDVVAFLATESRKRSVAIELQTSSIPLVIVGDRIQIQQVFINLILNAMDALESTPKEKRELTVCVSKHGKRATVEIVDNGQGIAAGDFDRLFDPFFSTKMNGMGLGLPIARTLIEAHGGDIRAENGSGSGAKFRVELPVAHSATHQ